jgi:hypothetical protein
MGSSLGLGFWLKEAPPGPLKSQIIGQWFIFKRLVYRRSDPVRDANLAFIGDFFDMLESFRSK